MEQVLISGLINILIGGGMGLVGGMFGIGGGLIAIPLLVFVYGLDQSVAQGTTLVMMTPNLVIGYWRYRQLNPIAHWMAVVLGLSAVTTSYFAAQWAADLPTLLLRQIFASFLVVLSALLWWNASRKNAGSANAARAPRWTLPLVGMIGGSCAGFFSIGGGIVATPLLTAGFGVTQAAAQGLSLALMTPGSVMALWAYAQAGLVDWWVAIPLTIGGMLGMSPGVVLAHRLPERKLRRLFALLLAATAVAMFHHPA